MRKSIFLILLVLPTIVFSQGVIRFSELKASSFEEKHFKELVTIELVKANLEPSDFYVTKIIDAPETIKLQIQHKDDRLLKNQYVIGNPSGKSQVCEYSKINKKLISCLYSQ